MPTKTMNSNGSNIYNVYVRTIIAIQSPNIYEVHTLTALKCLILMSIHSIYVG